MQIFLHFKKWKMCAGRYFSLIKYIFFVLTHTSWSNDILKHEGSMSMNSKNNNTAKPAKNAANLHVESVYDDDNIPEVDTNSAWETEPLPESTRPRKDGPGGESDD